MIFIVVKIARLNFAKEQERKPDGNLEHILWMKHGNIFRPKRNKLDKDYLSRFLVQKMKYGVGCGMIRGWHECRGVDDMTSKRCTMNASGWIKEQADKMTPSLKKLGRGEKIQRDINSKHTAKVTHKYQKTSENYDFNQVCCLTWLDVKPLECLKL